MNTIHDNGVRLPEGVEPKEEPRQGLWSFRIAEREVAFWGKYGDVLRTARDYALKAGHDPEAIALVECRGLIGSAPAA